MHIGNTQEFSDILMCDFYLQRCCFNCSVLHVCELECLKARRWFSEAAKLHSVAWEKELLVGALWKWFSGSSICLSFEIENQNPCKSWMGILVFLESWHRIKVCYNIYSWGGIRVIHLLISKLYIQLVDSQTGSWRALEEDIWNQNWASMYNVNTCTFIHKSTYMNPHHTFIHMQTKYPRTLSAFTSWPCTS